MIFFWKYHVGQSPVVKMRFDFKYSSNGWHVVSMCCQASLEYKLLWILHLKSYKA